MKPVSRFSFLLALSAATVWADEVTDWTRILVTATSVLPPVVSPRHAAIVQAAIFDALNGVERRYEPIHVQPAAPHGASKRAAVVQAAYVTLAALLPDQTANLTAERAKSLAGIAGSGGLGHSHSIALGIEWGQTVANLILSWRSMDGFSITPPAYTGGTNAGQWRPTPPDLLPGGVPQLATTTPFAIRSPSQFRPMGPPPVTSDRYAMDFNEVKEFGSINSQKRTADQTRAAQFWEASAPVAAWNPLALNLAARRNLSMLQESFLLAQVNLGMADAMIACWDAKYYYSFWRPITAIELADLDGNPKTERDLTWTPLLITPPFPEYPSGHACASGAAARILSLWFGDNTRFQVTPYGVPDTRTFSSFTSAINEVKHARILGGIHFRTACEDGHLIGMKVADYLMDKAFRPLQNTHAAEED